MIQRGNLETSSCIAQPPLVRYSFFYRVYLNLEKKGFREGLVFDQNSCCFAKFEVCECRSEMTPCDIFLIS